MKRFFLSMLAVISLMTACNMSELESVNRAGDRIGFLTTTNGLTKAVDVTTANLTAFTVEAFNHNTVTSPYMNAVAFTGSNGSFESAEPYYWPEGALDFYAYSQGAAEGQVVKSDYRTFNITPAASPASQVDFVYAGVTNQTKAGSTEGAIPLNFRHTESKIVVQVKNTAPNLKFVVDAWKVGYLDEAGTFTYNGNETNAYDATTVGAGTLDAGMWSNNTTFSASNTYTNTLASSVNIAASSSSPTLLGGEMILIPQVTTAADAYASASASALVNGSYVAVKIKILNRANDAVIYSDGAGSSAWAIWPVAFNWEPGKKYTYTLDLAGGGYYEVNNDTDADLDAILAGAVISFASVTVDNFAQQSAQELVAPKMPSAITVSSTDYKISKLKSSISIDTPIDATGNCYARIYKKVGDEFSDYIGTCSAEILYGKAKITPSVITEEGDYKAFCWYGGDGVYEKSEEVSVTFTATSN